MRKKVLEAFYLSEFIKRKDSVSGRQKPTGKGRGSTVGTDSAVSVDLAYYVFLKATEDDVESLVNDKRNTLSHVRLRYYMDTDGRNATVPTRMKEVLSDEL